MRTIGTSARGIRLPVVMTGHNLVSIVADALMKASKGPRDLFEFRDGDIVGVTESLVARAQGNYVTIDHIASEVNRLAGPGDVVVLFPILSRNRFLQVLRGIVAGVTGKVHLLLSWPVDEVGNALMDPADYYLKADQLSGPVFDEEEYHRVFGAWRHPFTSVDYVELYKAIDPSKIEIHFANSPLAALEFSNRVIVAGIHTRKLHRQLLENRGATAITLDQICAASAEGQGWNEQFGLLGSNYAGEHSIKLFPRDCEAFVTELQNEMEARTGRKLEVLVYGDGAFKDPAGGIWELADPVVSPACTQGLCGLPHEIKFKYIADNAGTQDPEAAVREAILGKSTIEATDNRGLGTTPRRLSDLVGSLCDLMSGSGDKGTPVIYISGYFDNYLDQ